jgi:hypothetical protein
MSTGMECCASLAASCLHTPPRPDFDAVYASAPMVSFATGGTPAVDPVSTLETSVPAGGEVWNRGLDSMGSTYKVRGHDVLPELGEVLGILTEPYNSCVGQHDVQASKLRNASVYGVLDCRCIPKVRLHGEDPPAVESLDEFNRLLDVGRRAVGNSPSC